MIRPPPTRARLARLASIRLALLACKLACVASLVCACSEPVVVLGDRRTDSGPDMRMEAGASVLDAMATSRDAGDGHVVVDAGAVVVDAAAPVLDAGDGHVEPIDHECFEVEPVCGVDNMVYLNRCYAADAGVAIAKPGPC